MYRSEFQKDGKMAKENDSSEEPKYPLWHKDDLKNEGFRRRKRETGGNAAVQRKRRKVLAKQLNRKKKRENLDCETIRWKKERKKGAHKTTGETVF